MKFRCASNAAIKNVKIAREKDDCDQVGSYFIWIIDCL